MIEERFEIRLSGSGGQGIIMAAIVLAEAVGVYQGKYVCQTQNYGPEVRGGASMAEVVMSSHPIDYPKAIQPDILLAMNQVSCDTYFRDLKLEGLLIVDATLVQQIPTQRAVAIPFTEMSKRETGKEMAANMVALGAVGYLSGAVSPKSLETALTGKFSKEIERSNRKALRAGIRAAQKVDLKGLPRYAMVEEEEV